MTIVLSESETEQRLKVHVECRRRQHEEERNGLEGGNFACGATKKPKSAHRMDDGQIRFKCDQCDYTKETDQRLKIHVERKYKDATRKGEV